MHRAIVMIGVIGLCAAMVDAEIKPLPEAARTAIEKDDWPEVLKIVQPLTRDAGHEAAHYAAGLANYQLQHYAQAGPLLLRAAQLAHDPGPAAVMLAYSAMKTSNADWMAAAVQAAPLNAEVCYLAGRSDVTSFARIEVLSFWDSLENPSDKSRDLYAERRAYTSRAEKYLKTAVLADPQHGPAHALLAVVYSEIFSYELVVAHARQAIQLTQVGGETYLTLARALFELERYNEAADVIAAGTKAAPQLSAVFEFDRGKLLYRVGRFEEAVEAFSLSMKTDPFPEEVYYRLGAAAHAARNYRLAIWALNKSIVVDKDIRAYFILGRCCYDLQLYAKAEELIKKAMDLDHGFRHIKNEWRFWRAMANWKLGKKAEAVEYMHHCVRSNPDNLYAAQWAFHMYKELNDPFGAIEICRLVGVGGHPDLAMRSLQSASKLWFRPQWKNYKGRTQRFPHHYYQYLAAAEIQIDKGNFGMAWGAYWRVMRSVPSYSTTEAIWTAMMVNEYKQSERLGKLLHARSKGNVTHGLLIDIAVAQLAQRKHDEIETLLADSTLETLIPYRDAVRFWSSALTGNEEAAKLRDPFTALGVVGYYQLDKNRRPPHFDGLFIRHLLPGSPLVDASTPIRPRDVILEFDSGKLTDWRSLVALRKKAMPDKPVRLRVRRGKDEFYTTVDFRDVDARRPKPLAVPVEKEVQP